MSQTPLVLVSPDMEPRGVEFGDQSISLSEPYLQALLDAGGLPLVMPTATSRQCVAECVRRADGVLLTGGGDVEPSLYGNGMSPRLRRTVRVTPDGGTRDFRELTLIDEAFRQRKPLLAICRGHQLLNVALGGTLLADIASQVPGALNHRRPDRRDAVVHEAALTADSLLAKITGSRSLGVNSTHHQAVARLAEPLMVAARSSDGVVEGLQLKPDAARWLPFLLSVQFHPERLARGRPEHQAIFRAFIRACASKRKRNL